MYKVSSIVWLGHLYLFIVWPRLTPCVGAHRLSTHKKRRGRGFNCSYWEARQRHKFTYKNTRVWKHHKSLWHNLTRSRRRMNSNRSKICPKDLLLNTIVKYFPFSWNICYTSYGVWGLTNEEIGSFYLPFRFVVTSRLCQSYLRLLIHRLPHLLVSLAPVKNIWFIRLHSLFCKSCQDIKASEYLNDCKEQFQSMSSKDLHKCKGLDNIHS